MALFWAEFLSIQNKKISLKEKFSDLYKVLSENEKVIIDEINENKGNKIDLNGYYKTDDHKTKNVMRPSKTLNLIIDNL